jgi:hypothetical protein
MQQPSRRSIQDCFGCSVGGVFGDIKREWISSVRGGSIMVFVFDLLNSARKAGKLSRSCKTGVEAEPLWHP